MDFKLQKQAISNSKRAAEKELREWTKILQTETDPAKREDIQEWMNDTRQTISGLIDAKQSIEALEKLQALFKA
jgi:predicted DNA-binding protein YlxM (UPF0122 family)